MPIKRPELINNEIYHVVIRAVGDTVVFKNERDFYRGIFSIYEFNNSNSVEIWLRRQQRKKEKLLESSGQTLGRHTSQCLDKREKTVEVFAFSFMSNHLHLLLKQLKDNGITQFMKKVGGGYAKYFNDKYSRKGHLFSRFQVVHIKTDEQLKNVFTYIHTNRISIIEPGWKEAGIKNPEKVIEFLENDKWHSYPDYLGKKNFPSVTEREFLLDIMNGAEGCREFINNWIKYKKELKDLGDIISE
ncbi:transposase [Patescibacteria group bacterium]|nr:transposase [Patescibacteria group bacterium]